MSGFGIDVIILTALALLLWGIRHEARVHREQVRRWMTARPTDLDENDWLRQGGTDRRDYR